MLRQITMNTGCILCGIFCMIFLFFALLFTILKEKGAMLISGFNTMPREKRELYDKAKMSTDQRNAFLIWTIILGIGVILSYCVTKYMAIIAFAVWLVVFLKDVHLDAEKVFEKYRFK